MNMDESREFLEELPELAHGEAFCFDCNPKVPCFNRCCAELTLPLTPYDILRLRRHIGISSGEFMASFTRMNTYADTGFPLPMLRMLKEPDEPCPFVTPGGCMVYDDRPSACRAYPLGRGTKMGEAHVEERVFIVREEHCHGFDQGTARTSAQWFEGQGLVPYNTANDHYMRLMAMVRDSGKPLDNRLSGMSRLCLFHLDDFRGMIGKMRIFAHVAVDETRQSLIMEDSLAGDEACLTFSLDWLELVIFGKSQGIKRK